MADPALQQLIFQSEATYRPQYTALNQRDLMNTLIGVAPGTEEGFYGTLDLADMAARRQAALGQSLQTQATEFGLAQLGAYAPQAREAYLSANPQMAAALAQAESMGGRQVSGYLNEMGRLAMQAPQTQAISPERVAAMGGFTPQQVAAQQVQLGGVLTPERAAAERIAAGQVQAGQIGAGALGESLYQQALQAQQQSALSQALQAQGMARATAPGQLTPEEIRAATQGTREGFAASGRLADNAAIAGEALARAGAARERSVQDIALAQQINQQLLGAQQQGQALATDVLRADIARQQANVGTQLQAGQFNVSSALDASRANQQAALQAALANQAAGNMAQQFNITNAQNVQQMNQAANLQAALANQGVGQRAFEFGAGQNLAAQQFNAQLGMSAAEANRAYQAQQAQQRFANLGAVLGSEQAMLGADRAYALQQAGQQQGITAASLGLIGFGQTPYALGLGAQQQGISQGQMGMGPQLFDPSAGINLGLQNAANLGNYQAATYGARAAAQGQIAGATIGAIGNVAAAFAPKLPAPTPGAPCWVAREVYGVENPKWVLFREWLFSKAPAWFRNLYIKYGERFAEFISNKPKLKSLIRRWMDSRISYNFA
jgi:hypothetical protein